MSEKKHTQNITKRRYIIQ